MVFEANIDPECQRLYACQKYAGNYPPLVRSLSTATFSALHDFYVRPRLEYGEPTHMQRAITEPVNLERMQQLAKCLVEVLRGLGKKTGYGRLNFILLAIEDFVEI